MSVTRIQLRRGTASQWASSSDVVLAAGEIGFETDTNSFKIGNGEIPWSELPYFKNVDELNSLTDNNLSNYARVSQLSSYLSSASIGVPNGIAGLDSNGQIPASQLQNIIDGAPESLDTLNEIAQILQADETGLDAILIEIGSKVSKAGDTIKGDLVVQNSDSPGTGTGRLTGNTLRLLSTEEADLTSTGHALQIGADNSTKLKIDQNEIQATDSANAANTLQIQPHGGQTTFGAGGISVSGDISTGNAGSLSVGSGGIVTTGKISSLQPILDISSGRTLIASDKFTMIRSTTASAITVTVPNILAKGERIDFVQWGAGQITFSGSGVTLASNGSKFKTGGQYAAVSLVKVDDVSSYLLIGNLVA